MVPGCILGKVASERLVNASLIILLEIATLLLNQAFFFKHTNISVQLLHLRSMQNFNYINL